MTIIDEALSKEQEEAETALYRYATAAAKSIIQIVNSFLYK